MVAKLLVSTTAVFLAMLTCEGFVCKIQTKIEGITKKKTPHFFSKYYFLPKYTFKAWSH